MEIKNLYLHAGELKCVRQISTPMAFYSTCVKAPVPQWRSPRVGLLEAAEYLSSDLPTHKKNHLFYEMQDFWPFCLNLQCTYSLCINNLTMCTNPQTKTSNLKTAHTTSGARNKVIPVDQELQTEQRLKTNVLSHTEYPSFCITVTNFSIINSKACVFSMQNKNTTSKDN